MSPAYDNSPMGHGLGGGQGDFGMEGYLWRKVNDNGDVELNWQVYLSEEKQQDS